MPLIKRWAAAAACAFCLALPLVAQEDPLPDALAEQLDQLVLVTETIRGLPTTFEVERAFPTRDETIAYLTALYDADADPVLLARQQAFYRALGMIPPDADLRQTFLDLLGSQVGGFYSSDERTMNVLPSSGDDVGEGLSPSEQIIFVHEYTHALQDMHFGLDLVYNESLLDNPDGALAVLSLIEGDASLAMNAYTQLALAQNPLLAFALLAESASAGTLVLPPGIPAGLTRELTFPYDYGMAFATALYSEGGWEAVNAAYDNPPASSEQILHPEKYLAGEFGETVAMVPLDAPGLTPLWEITLGEYYTQELLRGLNIASFRLAASGWNGDRFGLYESTAGRTAWSLASRWDSQQDADEFVEAVLALAPEDIARDMKPVCWDASGGELCLTPARDTSLETLLTFVPD
ncbi:MAG: hypothetical protein KME04_09385 [Pleurocapsa minor GSE-CHR-MK-17-07R]|jgi:hypothetical protein|nr:hypothetical protein [Pleurocapsa minor GSE-CHR-MK 17-07R]